MTKSFFRLLVITDHRRHQAHESLYPLLQNMRKNPACAEIVVISRAHPQNVDFFVHQRLAPVFGVLVDEHFDLESSKTALFESDLSFDPSSFHRIFLRLPKPNPADWFAWLEQTFGADHIINRPLGILKTGSKAYLTQFRDLCPPVRLCYSLNDVRDFQRFFPKIVLKPLSEAGGKGLIKIEDDMVWDGQEKYNWESFEPILKMRLHKGMLAMEYQNHVQAGDKRILVVNGQIVGSSLRLPAADSWLCNVSKGGQAIATGIAPEEREMAAILAQDLHKEGILIFGFDTLMGNGGERILSEINTSCPGGFLPAEMLSGEPVIARSAYLIWQFLLKRKLTLFPHT